MYFRVKKYFEKQPLSCSQTPTKTQQNNLKEHIEEINFFSFNQAIKPTKFKSIERM
jgi:hypothetical protein